MQINGEVFKTKEAFGRNVTIPDCFVKNDNKIGGGNGEAKLYLGSKKELESFFESDNFKVECMLLKSDLINYMNAVESEYHAPTQAYSGKDHFSELWKNRMDAIKNLDDVVFFTVKYQNQIEGPRGYINSESNVYDLIRSISLPNITFLYIEKLSTLQNNIVYYWKIYADFDLMSQLRKNGPLVYNYGKSHQMDTETVCNNEIDDKTESTYKGRKGQDKYREALMGQTIQCPITQISDERLLIASHIKPWAVSSDEERLDPYNGYMLSPLIDRLFDQGYMTFTEDRRIRLSVVISPYQWNLMNLKDNDFYSKILMDDKRIQYLDFHHKNIFKGYYEI